MNRLLVGIVLVGLIALGVRLLGAPSTTGPHIGGADVSSPVPQPPPSDMRGGNESAGQSSVPAVVSRIADSSTVVLVHGLGRRAASMAPLGRALLDRGYRVVNLGYPSWTEPADTLVALLADSVAACCGEQLDRVHFVTHSLGGILVRKYLSEREEPYRGRVVMLSPPNQGSELIDIASAAPWLTSLLGPVGSELGTEPESLPNQLEAPDYDLGIITGDRSLNPIYSWLIPGPDDGKVSIESAELEGAPLLVMPYSHSFIMNQDDVLHEIDHFLEWGTFSPEAMDAWAHEHTAPQDSVPAADTTQGLLPAR